MTKAKSLVTVLVTDAFTFFPIDSERYELAERLDDIVRILDGGPVEWFKQSEGRVYAFLQSVESTIRLASLAYCYGQEKDLTRSERTLRNRTRAAIVGVFSPNELVSLLLNPEQLAVEAFLWRSFQKHLRLESSWASLSFDFSKLPVGPRPPDEGSTA